MTMTTTPPSRYLRFLRYMEQIRYGSAVVLAVIFGLLGWGWYGVDGALYWFGFTLLFFLATAWGIKQRERREQRERQQR